jgi:hypothetical protein
MRRFQVGKIWSSSVALFVLLFAVSARQSLAAPILPGGVQFPAVAEAQPTGATTLVANSGPVAFTAATFSGTLTSQVLSGDTSNPFGTNALTFTYLITNNAGSPHDIARLAVSNYGLFQTDASYNGASGVPPTIISRSADGQVMGFDFISPALDAGLTSSLLVVQTNSTSFQPTTAVLIDGSTTSASSFAPLAVPEPVMLPAVGLLAAAMLRRRH